MRDVKARRGLVATARAMSERGLNRGTSGNASVRVPGGFLVTPSGLAYDRMRPADMVFVTPDGTPSGRWRPSTEWRFHRDVLASYPPANAVVHAHSPYATAVACLHEDLPAFHYTVGLAGGDSIRCAPYAPYGTQALSDAAVLALRGRKACLLANHGLIAIGATLSEALALAVEVEGLAQTWLAARAAGRPRILSKRQMADVLARLSTYGAKRTDGGESPRS